MASAELYRDFLSEFMPQCHNVLCRTAPNYFYIWYPDKIPPTKNPPEKNPPEKIHLNDVEREPVETRVLNPNASEASYKPEQCSYKKTKLQGV